MTIGPQRRTTEPVARAAVRAAWVVLSLAVGLAACGRDGDGGSAGTSTAAPGGVVERLDGSEMEVVSTTGAGRTGGDAGVPTGCGGLTPAIVSSVVGTEVVATVTADAKGCTFRGDDLQVDVFEAPPDTSQPGTPLPNVDGATYLRGANRVAVRTSDHVWFIGLDGGDLDESQRLAQLIELARQVAG